MSAAITSRRIENDLLAGLPAKDYENLFPDLEYVQLSRGEILHHTEEPIHHIYFPLNCCVVSLVSAMESGASAEVAIIGSEGMIGLPVFLGGDAAPHEAIVQVAGQAWRMKATAFKQVCRQSGAICDLLHLYTQAQMTQTAQLAACNRFHHVEERLVRWLLSMHDRIKGDEIKSTHEQMSLALGTRRAGISTAASHLQEMGLIDYRRGKIRIADRLGLEAAACECYEVVKTEFDRLLIADLAKKITNGRSSVDDTAGFKRETDAREAALEKVRELNSRLIIAGIREQEARDEAEAANEAKDQFLATLSHELRTPLTAMLGWSRMLRGRKLDENASARAIEIIERNAIMQRQLIENLLDVSRIGNGKFQLERSTIELAPFIEAAMDTVRVTADAKSISIQSAFDPDIIPHIVVSGDEVRLGQVVYNLLTNAIKFTPETGNVFVRLTSVNSTARISISDTGEGIAREFLPHVFDRFRQADTTSTRAHGGLGLGLAIARHIIELHDGTIIAESAGEGRGATFTINLPLMIYSATEKKGGGQKAYLSLAGSCIRQ